MLGVTGSSLNIARSSEQHPTCNNMSHEGGQTRRTCFTTQCCDKSRCDIAIVGALCSSFNVKFGGVRIWVRETLTNWFRNLLVSQCRGPIRWNPSAGEGRCLGKYLCSYWWCICFQAYSDEYSFLVYDSFERNMTQGNEWTVPCFLRQFEANRGNLPKETLKICACF